MTPGPVAAASDASALEIAPAAAHARQRAGAILLDVREPGERAAGFARNSLGTPLGDLEAAVRALAVPARAELLAICASGSRSLLAAQRLRRAGYAGALSVAGGLQRWRAEDLPVADGSAMLDALALERYDRHLRLPGVGADGQARLLASRVVVIGAGGLGSPAALYLAAAGVGTLVLVDDDRVERSNLQRQVLHDEAAIGELKAVSGARRLSALNPGIRIEAVPARLQPDTVGALFAGADLVVDGADNFATRLLVNQACLRLGIAWIYGAVERFRGQVSVFRPGYGPCYRCLFPGPPAADDAPSCAEAGVLGVLPGLVGMLQATEAIKYLLGIGESLDGRLLSVDALGMRFSQARLRRDPACPVCAPPA
jgi:molybdopterin/thiamine biosynthesis adenylyltransferase/rhodanese-related sulfurtransferase